MGAELRNWLRTSFQGIFTSGLSGRDALAMFRDFGGQIRTSDFYSIRREVLEEYNRQQEYTRQLAAYDPYALIPAGWHSTDHGLNLSTQFLYRVEVTGFDRETFEPVTRYLSVASDRQMTPSEVLAGANWILIETPESLSLEMGEAEIVGSMARPDTW